MDSKSVKNKAQVPPKRNFMSIMKNKLYFSLLGFLFILTPGLVHAHPTSFQGAWSLINESMPNYRHMMFTHSYRHWLAPAAHYSRIYIEQEDINFEMAAVGINTLFKRWNRPRSQGNFYISLAQGREFTNERDQRDVTLVDIDLDWEDRRFYIAGAYTRYFRSQSENDPIKARDVEIKKLRMGFAPYLGDFTDLNTWFIVQLAQTNQQTIEATPLLRFYYRNALWEIGSSLRGGWLFNFMLHL